MKVVPRERQLSLSSFAGDGDFCFNFSPQRRRGRGGTKMQILWCWRCKTDMPMLDENEFETVQQLYTSSTQRAKQFREETGASIREAQICYASVQQEYERITGLPNCDPHAIMHHRLSWLGQPCRVCGKPLRSPEGKRCVECGALKDII